MLNLDLLNVPYITYSVGVIISLLVLFDWLLFVGVIWLIDWLIVVVNNLFVAFLGGLLCRSSKKERTKWNKEFYWCIYTVSLGYWNEKSVFRIYFRDLDNLLQFPFWQNLRILVYFLFHLKSCRCTILDILKVWLNLSSQYVDLNNIKHKKK